MQRSSQIPDERGDPGMDRLRDPESVRLKGEYIAAQNLAGAMFWELSHDEGPLLDALRAGLRASPTR